MSLIFGSWQYKENVPTANTLQQMYNAVSFLPHLRHHSFVHEQTGFGQILTESTPESFYEKMPLFLADQQISFTAQGRIDNRVLLANKLGLKLSNTLPDGYLILKAYLKWGKECMSHLRGEWSFAAFNHKEQELFIANDVLGFTALYYYQDDTGFYFSSSIKSLLAVPSYQKKINEEHLIGRFSLWFGKNCTTSNTFYKNIFTIPTAHSITVKNKSIYLKKYWNPQNIPLRHYKNKQDYAEEMLDLLTNSVKARLRSHKPVASMLSGGLDSSTVSYIAADLLKPSNTALTTFSHIPLFRKELQQNKLEKVAILDESPLAKAVAKASGNINPLFLDSAEFSVLAGMKATINICSEPTHGANNLYWINDIYKTTAQKGFGTLLSGDGGNASTSFAGINYLLPLQLSALFKHPKQFIKVHIAWPIILKHFSGLLAKRKSITQSLEKYVSNIFLQPDFLTRYGIIEDIKKNNKEFVRYEPDIINRKELFLDLFHLRGAVGAAYQQYYGFDLRDPTTDVDLMEYFFSIPNEAFFDEHYNNRMIVKRMMKGKLPDEVLFEKKKGLQSADISYRAKAQQVELSDALNTISRNPVVEHFIDTKSLLVSWEQCINQNEVDPFQMQRLLKALEFGLFLQTSFD